MRNNNLPRQAWDNRNKNSKRRDALYANRHASSNRQRLSRRSALMARCEAAFFGCVHFPSGSRFHGNVNAFLIKTGSGQTETDTVETQTAVFLVQLLGARGCRPISRHDSHLQAVRVYADERAWYERHTTCSSSHTSASQLARLRIEEGCLSIMTNLRAFAKTRSKA